MLKKTRASLAEFAAQQLPFEMLAREVEILAYMSAEFGNALAAAGALLPGKSNPQTANRLLIDEIDFDSTFRAQYYIRVCRIPDRTLSVSSV